MALTRRGFLQTSALSLYAPPRHRTPQHRRHLPRRLRLRRLPPLRQPRLHHPQRPAPRLPGLPLHEFLRPPGHLLRLPLRPAQRLLPPGRTKVFGAHGPGARGLEPNFQTMGQVLKTAGYRTAVFGKWHIGDQPDTRPPASRLRRILRPDVFERYVGIPPRTPRELRRQTPPVLGKRPCEGAPA